MKKITSETIGKFKEYLLSEEKSLFTIGKYIRDISSFCTWCEEREITKQLVLEYKKHLLGKYAPTSVNSILSSLNSFFTYSDCHALKVKLLKIQRQIFSKDEKELTRAEYERLLHAPLLPDADNLLYRDTCI